MPITIGIARIELHRLLLPLMKLPFAQVALASVVFSSTVTVFAASKEPAFDVYVPLKPENVALGFYPFDKAPVVTVKSGTTVKIDGGGGSRWGDNDPDKWLKENKIPATLA